MPAVYVWARTRWKGLIVVMPWTWILCLVGLSSFCALSCGTLVIYSSMCRHWRFELYSEWPCTLSELGTSTTFSARGRAGVATEHGMKPRFRCWAIKAYLWSGVTGEMLSFWWCYVCALLFVWFCKTRQTRWKKKRYTPILIFRHTSVWQYSVPNKDTKFWWLWNNCYASVYMD